MFPNVLRILSAWPMVLEAQPGELAAAVLGGGGRGTGVGYHGGDGHLFRLAARHRAGRGARGQGAAGPGHLRQGDARAHESGNTYSIARNYVEGVYSESLGWFIEDMLHGGRSATMFLTLPGEEAEAGNDNARSYFVFLPGAEEKITILPGGRMPEPLLDPDVRGRQAPTAAAVPSDAPVEPVLRGDPISMEAIVPEDAALDFGLEVGDTLSAVPYWQDATPYLSVTVTGLYTRNDPDDLIWELNDRTFHSFTSGNFATVPFLVSRDTFLRGVGKAMPDMDSTYGWLLLVDPDRLSSINATDAMHSLVGIKRSLGER